MDNQKTQKSSWGETFGRHLYSSFILSTIWDDSHEKIVLLTKMATMALLLKIETCNDN